MCWQQTSELYNHIVMSAEYLCMGHKIVTDKCIYQYF